MQQESRVKKSLLNARVNLIFYFITLALSFFSRKIFLDCLGADFVGLTVTLQNLLGFLNLAELGIGLAIGYVLYKPLYEQDHSKLNEIISVFGYLYSWVGKIILVAGCILSAFLPLIFAETSFDYGVIYCAYFAFLTSSLIGYFINYRQTLLSADQRNYVVAAYFQTANICKILLQMLSAHYTGSYYLWIIIELTFGILYSIILNWKINQVYPWLKSDIKSGRELHHKYPEVMRYTKQLFVHKIGTLFQVQTTPILIYSFVSLQTVAFYGNYTMITRNLEVLLSNFLGSTSAGVGNLIAEGDKQKILKVYWELTTLRLFVSTIFCYAIYKLLPSFITLWVGADYLLSPSVLYLLLAIFFLSINRGTTDQFINGCGLFYDIWAPLAESAIYIVVALIGGALYGLPGILWGNIISVLVIIYCWKPYFLFSKGLKCSCIQYWAGWIKHLVVIAGSVLIANWLIELISIIPTLIQSWWQWVMCGCIVVSIATLVLFVILYILFGSMRNLTYRVILKANH